MPHHHLRVRLLCLGAVLALAACDQAPPSWAKLITAKITEQYPAYRVTASTDGGLVVERPSQASQQVDVKGIAQFCQRGPKDCDYAIDQLLLELRAPTP